MNSAEARDAGIAAGTTLRQLTTLVRGAHLAISDSVGDVVGTALASQGPLTHGIVGSVRVTQSAVAKGVYAATGLGLNAGARAAGLAAAFRMRGRDVERPSVHDAPLAHQIIAAGLGIRGDHFARTAPAIAPDMQVRREGLRVRLTREGLSAAYPMATGEIAVFLHGLCQSEAIWRRMPDLGMTPVKVRYNTGLRISDNGQSLDRLLADLVSGWPVPVERIALIGFSMGGLVIHSALASSPPDSSWRHLVTDTVTIGSPHHGSPLARGAARMTQRLSGTPRGAWLADFVRERSVGIKDLSHGNLVVDDWLGHDPDDLADHRTHPEASDAIRHHAVIGVLSGQLPAQVAERVGDIMVPVPSARHEGTEMVRTRFMPERTAVVTGAHHLALPSHDEVHAHLNRWINPPA